MNISILYVVCGSEDEARRIGRALVEARLAACCNAIPGMESVYRWEGAVHTARETVLIVKTRTAHIGAATDMIKALHSYKMPCVLPLAVREGGNSDYSTWIEAETA